MITISLDQRSAEFRPGDTISGSVSWSQLPEHITGLEARLLWYTEGKGNQDLDVVASQQLMGEPGDQSERLQNASSRMQDASTRLSSGSDGSQEGSARFDFTAPTRPFSFSGKLISLVWTIEVVLFPDADGYQEPITISSDGQEIELSQSFNKLALRPAVTVSR